MPFTEPEMRWVNFAAILCLFSSAIVGCSTELKPSTREIRREAAPTVESIDEFLALLEFGNLVNRVVSAEKAVLEERFAQARAKTGATAAQAGLEDEFFAKVNLIIDETCTPERIGKILNATIRQAFTQRDIDALTAFYRTQSGKVIVGELKQTIRPYFEEQKTRKELIGLDSEHDMNNQFASFMRVFSEAAQSHKMSQFYGNDIDDDIMSRLPNARTIYASEADPWLAESQGRLRELTTEYKAKIKALSSP